MKIKIVSLMILIGSVLCNSTTFADGNSAGGGTYTGPEVLKVIAALPFAVVASPYLIYCYYYHYANATKEDLKFRDILRQMESIEAEYTALPFLAQLKFERTNSFSKQLQWAWLVWEGSNHTKGFEFEKSPPFVFQDETRNYYFKPDTACGRFDEEFSSIVRESKILKPDSHFDGVLDHKLLLQNVLKNKDKIDPLALECAKSRATDLLKSRARIIEMDKFYSKNSKKRRCSLEGYRTPREIKYGSKLLTDQDGLEVLSQ